MEFKVAINAPREKVWNTLWDDASYRVWTAAFTPGSKAVTDWNKGSKILFLDSNERGMVSMIEEKIPNEFMSFKHLGGVENGVEDTESEEAKSWAGSYENYTLQTVNGITELRISMGGAEIPPDLEDHFKNAWPKALEKLKELSEKN
jgi:hypothetical protein